MAFMENVRALYNERTRYNLSRWHHVIRREVLREMLGVVFVNCSNKLVLDVGCGDGWYSNLLAELGFQVKGLDVSSSSLLRGKRRLKNAGFVCIN
jgi:2-polyprenyl-3-methyl-5-hydroxy-6-metoxy-1,4-benzoquinol methylase